MFIINKLGYDVLFKFIWLKMIGKVYVILIKWFFNEKF